VTKVLKGKGTCDGIDWKVSFPFPGSIFQEAIWRRERRDPIKKGGKELRKKEDHNSRLLGVLRLLTNCIDVLAARGGGGARRVLDVRSKRERSLSYRFAFPFLGGGGERNNLLEEVREMEARKEKETRGRAAGCAFP